MADDEEEMSKCEMEKKKGYLVSVDSYMNLQLANTEEYIEGQFTGNLGEILIRCNNVLYLRGVPEDEEIEDAAED
ncbi:small nuclear ribonucleoprotein [Vigna angularis]|uniref:Sm protein F n=1 Tax=Phaseolus angularis TaxID=3914 RepID=A0A8T0L9U8_PHAAN|nr:small nuclear ribonucleoprotein [Vigna angularis]